MNRAEKKYAIALIILSALFIAEIITGGVSYFLGVGLVKLSDIIFKIGIHLKYLHAI